MATATGKYLGGLRTEVRHSSSGQSFITDAPVDNNGKGEAFSPTDTVCAALSSCMMTLMGIYSERENINLEGMHSTIAKHMATNPRRISKIEIDFTRVTAPRFKPPTTLATLALVIAMLLMPLFNLAKILASSAAAY